MMYSKTEESKRENGGYNVPKGRKLCGALPIGPFYPIIFLEMTFLMRWILSQVSVYCICASPASD